MAKRITVPDDVLVVDPVTKTPLLGPNREPLRQTFSEYAIRCWVGDRRIPMSPAVMTRLVRHIVPALEAARPGAELVLEDQDYQMLLPIVQGPEIGAVNPQTGQNSALLNSQFMAFYEAFLEAKDVKAN